MKKLLYTLLITFPILLVAQTPQGINYQAVAYDANGFEIANQEISIRLGILLETADAESAYTETHQITTNDFGLFSLLIGQGNSTDDFSSLNWENGAFLKVELDANLDGEFVLMGVSSFNAVPYAFYAPTSSDIVSQLDSQSNQLEFYSTSLQELLDNGKTPIQIVSQGVNKERLYGLNYEGGIIFYISDDLSHGLVYSNDDLGYYPWGCSGVEMGAYNKEIGYGLYNTSLISSNCDEENIAAKMCLDYNINGYTDWFLPTKNELELIAMQYTDLNIWSSSETNGSNFLHAENSSHLTSSNHKLALSNIIPVRAFGDYVIGCKDEMACNYSENIFLADLSCNIPEFGKDCNNTDIDSLLNIESINIIINNISHLKYIYGLEAFGGIISHVDTGDNKLYIIHAGEDILLVPGCNGTHSSVFNQVLGAGMQNTIDFECNSLTSYALNFTDGVFDDWFLPSINELKISFSNLHSKNSLLEEPFLFGTYTTSCEHSPYTNFSVAFDGFAVHAINKISNNRFRIMRVQNY